MVKRTKPEASELALPPLFRQFEVREVNTETRSVELTFSSEEPYERWYGLEILDHGGDSIRLDRLRSAGVALWNHDRDICIGTLENVRIEGRRGACTIRFFPSEDPEAERIFQKIRNGLRNVSVGYRVYELVLEKQEKDGPDTYRVTDWEPFEVSPVSVPADWSIGVGREASERAPNPVVIRGADPVRLNRLSATLRAMLSNEPEAGAPELDTRSLTTVDDEGGNPGGGSPAPAPDPAAGRSADPDPTVIQAASDRGREAERKRQSSIREVADQFPSDEKLQEAARKAIDGGTSANDFYREALELLGHRTYEPRPLTSSDIPGVGAREQRRFSLARLVRALAVTSAPGFVDTRTANAWLREGGFELEICAAFRDQVGREPRDERAAIVPHDLLYEDRFRIVPGEAEGEHRILTVGTEGADIVDTDMRVEDFIEALRNRAVVVQAGAMVLPGLQGNVLIPKQTGRGSITWVAESGSAGDTTPTLGQVAMSPKTMAARTDISRRLLLQSAIVIDSFVRQDLQRGMTVELDRVAIEGNPDVTATANEPRGVIYQSGIGSVALGTNGANPTRSSLIDLATEVAVDNALMGVPAYLMNSLTIGFFMKLLLDTGSGRFVMETRDSVVGFPVHESNNVPADLTKGAGSSLSAIPFGDWSQMVIGLWSGQDILVDPYTQGATGALRLVAYQDVDVAVRQAVAFAAILDALLT